eukprot:CAMPEP_0176353936 /NCGR_PEP_ID=MMETSP0126-20121128/12167_1 /TAXON_ID=141414 ORGANISM="Strombidinopsis acuminatum, Strain SPMC142" /NCGR_SAMPLE_ID=MMETSP0126 /ASSEMBLY_ACC=CAM_ASM_000229 /LENGTH=78 /DNA_ID=CAMNT_0017705833 /DNA_START=3185 /DNA_END=3421 /DNA_ORIENTATION=-
MTNYEYYLYDNAPNGMLSKQVIPASSIKKPLNHQKSNYESISPEKNKVYRKTVATMPNGSIMMENSSINQQNRQSNSV